MMQLLIDFFLTKSGIVLALILVLLLISTLAIYLKWSTPELKQRIISWWYIITLFILGTMLNSTVAMIFFALLSYLALKEYFTLIPTRRTDRRIIFYAYLSIVAQYFFAGIGCYEMFIIWIPVYLFLLLP